MLLICWFFLVVLITGKFGRIFGIQFLFSDAEYLGQVNPISFGFLGLAFGVFVMVWNLSAYLMSAFRFPFLAALKRPFTKFVLNNFFLPLIVFIFLIQTIIHTQYFTEQKSGLLVFSYVLGFLAGFVLMVGSISAYLFFTNKDITAFVRQDIGVQEELPEISRQKLESYHWKVETYLSEWLRPRLVRSVAHYPHEILQKVYRQNHWNAFLLLSIGVVTLVFFGTLADHPIWFIPAGASILLLLSMLMMVSSAVTFWFRKWKFIVFIFLIVALNWLTKTGGGGFGHKVIGLNYSGALPEYKSDVDYDYEDEVKAQHDKRKDEKSLTLWKQRQNRATPPALFLCASGGGHRAGWWTVQVLKNLDRNLNEKLMSQTVLMSGASGGMTGLAFYRSLQLEKIGPEQKENAIQKYSDDLLNSIAFALVSNDLFPGFALYRKEGNDWIKSDRGLAFDRQFNENTNNILNKPFSAFAELERNGIIPSLFVAPTILNDGKRLLISSNSHAYMSRPPLYSKVGINSDLVEFNEFFRNQGAQNISLTTALRLNCTYPYILPNVDLPSQPAMEIMDAGFRDNTGVSLASRFIWHHADWLKSNTDKIVIIRILAGEGRANDVVRSSKGLIESLFSPLGFAGSILKYQNYEQENYIAFMKLLFGNDKIEVIDFMYRPKDGNERASMSFHLTQREKKDIENSIFLPENQESLERIKQLTK